MNTTKPQTQINPAPPPAVPGAPAAPAPTPASGEAVAAQKPRTTLVEEGTEFNGKMKSNCPLVIRGKVEGDIEAPSISVAQSGSMVGNARLGRLLSEGEITGTFEAESVRLAGRVGNHTVIRAKTLEAKVAPGKGTTVAFGECTLEIGDEPAEPGRGDAAKPEMKAAVADIQVPEPEELSASVSSSSADVEVKPEGDADPARETNGKKKKR